MDLSAVSLTATQGQQSLTTHYLLDGETLLAATADGATTYYLPGIGEKKQAWSYYLADGTNSVRQLSDPQGQVTLTRSFTPWGELLQLTGAGDFSWGYLGGLLDAATGLIYVGNGQYYDPATGRFLSRGVYPGSPNPYVPWQANPLGMIATPLFLLSLFRKNRKAGKIERILGIAITVLVMSAAIAGCTSGCGSVTIPTGTATPPSTPTPTATGTPDPFSYNGDNAGTTPTSPTENSPTPVPCPTPTGIPTTTDGPIPDLSQDASDVYETYLVLKYDTKWSSR